MTVNIKKITIGIPVTKTGDMERYENAIKWYVDVLGFEIAWKFGIASLVLANGQEILLFGEEDDENSLWYTGDIIRNPHFCIQFYTDKLEQLQSDLCNSGVVVGEITLGGGGDRMMMFCDPYGNRFWAIENL
jgi:catechol 2,3-dioxygenase-like lactoylglutathione lyase family enzyme